MTHTVEFGAGKVRGTDEGATISFKGIPYAEAVSGEWRFRRPRPPRPWPGIRSAECFGPAALQPRLVGTRPVEEQDEDCLTLNVWVPNVDSGTRLPVLVWVHGGAFEYGAGSSAMYNGAHLAASGSVIVVTFNYRLGALGCVQLCDIDNPRLAADSNLALRDQIAALQWVRDNIASFGGDPSRVTVGGDSAGAISVNCLLASPLARGLFGRAIVQSGGAHHVVSREQAQRVTATLLSALDLTEDTAERLLQLEARSLVHAQRACRGVLIRAGAHGRLRLLGFPFVPMVGDDVLPLDPLQAFHTGSSANVPLLIGTNRDEWAYFVYVRGDPQKAAMDHSRLRDLVERRVPGCSDELIARYQRALAGPHRVPTPVELYVAIESDRFFRIPALRIAESRTHAPAETYMYLFSWRSPMLGGVLRSCHTLELPFVFGHVGQRAARIFTGQGQEAVELRDLIMKAWANFVHCGAPASPVAPDWQRYGLPIRPTMMLRADAQLELDPLSAQRTAWDEIL